MPVKKRNCAGEAVRDAVRLRDYLPYLNDEHGARVVEIEHCECECFVCQSMKSHKPSRKTIIDVHNTRGILLKEKNGKFWEIV